MSDLYQEMDNGEALFLLGGLAEQEVDIWDKAQEEYSEASNIFANFNRVAERLEITPEQVLLVYALKHMDGIISWAKGNKMQRESVQGRIQDLRIYMAILYLMANEEESGD